MNINNKIYPSGTAHQDGAPLPDTVCPIGMCGMDIKSVKLPENSVIQIVHEPETDEKVFPMGMCGTDRNVSKSTIKSIGAIGKTVIKGDLNQWRAPACEMIISTGSHFTCVNAIIDTGAYHTHVNTNLLKQINSVCKGDEAHRTPLYGDKSLPIHTLMYSFKEKQEVYFISDVRGMDYDEVDMLIGARFIIEFCDLHIFGREQRFELNFY